LIRKPTSYRVNQLQLVDFSGEHFAGGVSLLEGIKFTVLDLKNGKYIIFQSKEKSWCSLAGFLETIKYCLSYCTWWLVT